MPELPEVENMARQLDANFAGRVIKAAPLITPSMLKYPVRAAFERKLIGARILSVSRRAKYAVFDLDGGRTLLIHPKMTGHFLVHENKKTRKHESRHIRFSFIFEDGRELGFSDVRKFGTVRLFNKSELEKFWKKEGLGPEPMDLSAGDFVRLIGSKTGRIKQVLMDPKVIAGIGNIYSDEMLHISGIHPERRAKNLSRKELGELYKNMKRVLQNGVALGGSSINNYRLIDGGKGRYQEIRVAYGREGEPCGKCFEKIKRIRMGGRSAHFCPGCQKIDAKIKKD